MPFPARTLALPLLVTALLTACGDSDDGGGSVVGRVSDVDGRICLLDDDAVRDPAADGRARCFSAAPELLAATAVGDCVRLDYETREARSPEALRTTESTACPAPA